MFFKELICSYLANNNDINRSNFYRHDIFCNKKFERKLINLRILQRQDEQFLQAAH